jgi:putative membrane-bound dehydrogenase-like protein
MRWTLSLGLLCLLVTCLPGAPDPGVLPVGADGKPLNLDFETGTLKDWTAEGDAFKGQPVKGDTVAKRRPDMKSEHQGNYWIGTYEREGDKPQGTLTSVPFKITHPWATFMVAGGPHPETCVELVFKEKNEVFLRASGTETENLRRVLVDLRKHQGKEMYIRLVDKHSGGWGHINFDDFRFHTEKPDVPPPPTPLPGPDTYKYAGLSPEKSAEVMTVPPGFKVSLFAGEPDVRQPIAFCFDDRGRLWVVEAYSYPQRQPEGQGKDRILIFEDTTGAGKFDKRTVFMEGLNLVSGIAVGFGGVWVGAAPQFLFIPVNPGEDKPAGKPQVLLDGWGYQDTHETLNTFVWGPDGWLYGCHGVFTHSRVGKPGTPDAQRTPINAGIWRYHPTRHVFEVFAEGTSNPWGLDFDTNGQMFIEACVIPHNWHIIQGGRYQRQAGAHFNPYTYADILTIAKHRHYVGANPHGGNNRSDSVGGGHAHCGTMIYQGGAWPAEWNGKMFMGNIHGHRINIDKLAPQGSGYTADYAPDFLLSHDRSALFVNLMYGPDGNVYLIDWYDKQSCHNGNPEIWDRATGRIYKVSHADTKPVVGIDLAKKSDTELVELQKNPNDWYVRHARRLLQERAARGELKPETRTALAALAFGDAPEPQRLRALWALHSIGGLVGINVTRGLADKNEFVRSWTIQLALENGTADAARLARLAELAASDPSPVVRRYLASGAQRLPLGERWAILEKLLTHAEDTGDHNLPLLYWYAAEPLATVDAERALSLGLSAKVAPLPEFMARRIAALGTPEAIELIVGAVAKSASIPQQASLLRNLQEGLKGRRQVAMPKSWPTAYDALLKTGNADLKSLANGLATTFGDARAFAELRKVAETGQVLQRRQEALESLLAARDPQLPPLLQRLVSDADLRGQAIRGLASYDDPKTPEILLAAYSNLKPAEKRDALATLAARASYGRALIEAVAAKKLTAADVPAETVRQLRNLNDAELTKKMGDVWGVVRTTPADRAKLIDTWRTKLSAPDPKPDLPMGRAIFQKVCAQCHQLYGTGGKVGPDITGANRPNLDYLLENVFDPSAVIPKDYTMTLVTLKSGRVVSGIIKGETPVALTVVTPTETLTIPVVEVEERTPSNISMMPDDLMKTLSEAEVRALFAYLRHPSQVPYRATVENAKDFFNGKDLTGWDGAPGLWQVVDGEIVGKTTGLKKNEFLKSHLLASDFRLSVQVKLTPDKENSGIQFRSEPLPDGEMKGPQADVGAGWWGKLYEESGRGLIWDKSGEQHVKPGEWNLYVVEARGDHVKTWINGHLCVDLTDPMLAREGIFGLQIHSGGPMEVRFKDMKLEVLPAGR